MRIGFSSIYAWRPHVEHLFFLAKIASEAGHATHFLACDGDLPTCYTRELRDRAAWQECLQCRAGGIRSYASRDVTGLSALPGGAAAGPTPHASAWAESSASTLGRFESDDDYQGDDFRGLVSRLTPAVEKTYAAAVEWIRRNRLEAICVFNARMDATRAIAEAARAEGIRYVSLERTWFGDGLQLLPDENCLGLRAVHSMVREWSDFPLTAAQAARAASHAAGRFLRTNTLEWRAYNTNARNVSWPGGTQARRKILFLPSSRNEVWGHSDWNSQWSQPTAAYDALIERFDLAAGETVLRCHPNWSENIGKHTGARAEHYYSQWAAARGIPCIGSADAASTMSLIDQCDAIVVASGSAALEAGVLGKQIISVAPAIYQEAGFRDSAYDIDGVRALRLNVELDPATRLEAARRIARRTLRFCYTAACRLPQYTRFVRAVTTTKYRYEPGADAQRFTELLRTGILKADDEVIAADTSGEDSILDIIERRAWGSVRSPTEVIGPAAERIQRRPLFRPMDWIGDRKSVGDR